MECCDAFNYLVGFFLGAALNLVSESITLQVFKQQDEVAVVWIEIGVVAGGCP